MCCWATRPRCRPAHHRQLIQTSQIMSSTLLDELLTNSGRVCLPVCLSVARWALAWKIHKAWKYERTWQLLEEKCRKITISRRSVKSLTKKNCLLLTSHLGSCHCWVESCMYVYCTGKLTWVTATLVEVLQRIGEMSWNFKVLEEWSPCSKCVCILSAHLTLCLSVSVFLSCWNLQLDCTLNTGDLSG